MSKLKDFERYPFIMETKNRSFQKLEIYRYSQNAQLFFLVTPTHNDVPKVLCLEEAKQLILNGKFIQYKKSPNIYEKINNAWENWSEEWTYNGEIYEACPSIDIISSPLHYETNGSSYRIGYHHGKLVCVGGFQYLPKIKYCYFEANGDPDWSKGGWTNSRHIFPVYNLTKETYI